MESLSSSPDTRINAKQTRASPNIISIEPLLKISEVVSYLIYVQRWKRTTQGTLKQTFLAWYFKLISE